MERADPAFRKYFDWPTHKDPKGTVKARNVFEKKPSSYPLVSSRSFVRPIKKKRKMASRTSNKSKVTDKDFLLLEAFIVEMFDTEKPAKIRIPNSIDQVDSFM